MAHNHCIATDQESAMYEPIHMCIKDTVYLGKSSHRLDTYHFFSQTWEDIELKYKGSDTKYIIMILKDVYRYLIYFQNFNCSPYITNFQFHDTKSPILT